MNWFRINKAATSQPRSGTYQDWKPLLALEAKNQCVYCSIHEQSFGGERNFHVEHFKPKSRFTSLRNHYDNLFYACAICNTFKGSAWPGVVPSDFSRAGFIDPSKADYSSVFQIDGPTGQISAERLAGRYMLEHLHLNRTQLILERRVLVLEARLLKEEARLSGLIGQWEAAGCPASVGPLIRKAYEAIGNVVRLQVIFRRLRPYEPKDVRRPKKRGRA